MTAKPPAFTSFSALLDAMNLACGTETTLNLPPDWMQGRAGFGGLVVAAALRTMRNLTDPERHPRSLQVSFAGPVAAGPARVTANLLRSGRAVTQLESKILQHDETLCAVLGVFGADRESTIRVEAQPRPMSPPPEEGFQIPYVEGLTPTFTQHFDYRYTIGSMLFSGAKTSRMGGWCRFRHESYLADHEAVAALVDAWPPAVLQMLGLPAPASSLTWMLEFLQWDSAARTDDWWFYVAEADAASGGYAQTRAYLWDPTGRLAAIGSQTVAVFG
jgi:acyl-CoA thioesterase